MRAALKEPVLRWEWWIASEASMRPALEEVLRARCQALEVPFVLWRGKDPRAVAVLTSWALGTEARQEHQVFSCSPEFRALAPLIERQVEVRLLATRGLLWDDLVGSAAAFVEVTRDVIPDATRKRGGRAALPAREDLPVLEGAQVWPVIGHQGRLVALISASASASMVSLLEERWGPLAEPSRWFELASQL